MLDGTQGRRRLLLGALVALVTVFVALGAGPSASAKDAQKIPAYGSKAGFQAYCESLGGTFIEDGLGNTECHYPDGSWTECDANGDDCWHTPARPAPPVDGTIPSVPIVDGTDQNAAGDDQQTTKAKHHKGKKGKSRGHHRKGHKR